MLSARKIAENLRNDRAEGYQAGLNEWPYDLTKKDSADYNEGWKEGCKKREAWNSHLNYYI